jgi:hypothetical protein
MRTLLLAAIAFVALTTLACPPRLTQERVLAEAVSSYGDTGQVFVVANTVTPYAPLGFYPTRAAADSAAARAGDTYRAFGPYHGLAARDPWEVLSITVRVRTAGGERELHYDPRTVDAVFFSSSAVRKFLLPYYKKLYGDDFANAVAVVVGVPRPPTPPCHKLSFPCTVDSLLVPMLPRE